MARYLKMLWGEDVPSSIRESRESSGSEDIHWDPYGKPPPPPDPRTKVTKNKPKTHNTQSQIPARVWLVKYLKDSIQGLVSHEAATGLSHSQVMRSAQQLDVPAMPGSPYQMIYDERRKEKKASLDERNHHVRNICLAVEQCCFHNLKLKEFKGVLPFWSLIEHTNKFSGDSVQSACKEVCQHTNLSTPIGKARGFIRYAVEVGKMEDSLAQLLEDEMLLHHFYYPDALMLCPEGTSILLSLVASLQTFVFKFDLDCQDLNDAPEWPLLEELTLQLKGNAQPPPPARRLSWTEDDIPAFESVILDIEHKIQRVIITPLQASNKLLLALSWELGQRAPPPLTLESVSARAKGDDHSKHKGIFGVPLFELIADAKRCQHANLDPALGVPRAVIAVLDALEAKIFTPTGLLCGLFRKEADPLQLSYLVKAIETTQGIPADMDPHSLAAALLFFLHKLPEPLMTYERYDAFVDCQKIVEGHARRRNIRLLVEELPWWHKPLLLRLVQFLHRCCKASFPTSLTTTPQPHSPLQDFPMKHGPGVMLPITEHELGGIFTSALLRSYEPDTLSQESERLVESGDSKPTFIIVQTLILDYDYVFRGVQREQNTRKKLLLEKVHRIQDLNERAQTKLAIENAYHLHLLKVLWLRLAQADAICAQQLANTADKGDSLSSIKEGDHKSVPKRDKKEAGAGLPALFSDSDEDEMDTSFVELDETDEHGARARRFRRKLTDEDRTHSLPSMLPTSNSEAPVIGSPWSAIHELHSGAGAGRSVLRDRFSSTGSFGYRISGMPYSSKDATSHSMPRLRRRKTWGGQYFARSLADFGISEQQGPSSQAANTDEPIILKRISSLDLSDTGLGEVEPAPVDLFQSFSLTHKRWAAVSINPAADFSTTGILTLECMNYFLERFPALASKMVASKGHEKRIAFSKLSVLVSKLLANVIGIAHPNEEAKKVVLTEISNKPFWKLLDNPLSYMELFCILMMLVDMVIATGLEPDLTSCLSKARELFVGALNTWPLNLDELWKLWMDMAIESEKNLCFHHDYFKDNHDDEHNIIRSRNTSQLKEEIMAKLTPTNEEEKITSGLGEDGLIWKRVGPYVTQLKTTSKILTVDWVLDLEKALPPANQACSWELMYSIAEHGANLYTLLRLCAGVCPSLLIIKDQKGGVFGTVVDEPWQKKGEQYFGSGGTFVFQLGNSTQPSQAFRWSGKNRYFMLCNDNGLGIGGGGHFAIYLDSELYHGSSGQCTTFESPALTLGDEIDLTGSARNFICMELEVWAILPVTSEPLASRQNRANTFGGTISQTNDSKF